jgi:NDP-sugar pyrophosphorylase family protein
MKAIILAAGKGSRLGPLGAYTSKAALPLLGKPLVTRVLDSLRDLADSFVIVIHPDDDQTRELLRHAPWSEIKLEVVEQPEQLGSGDALRRAWPRVRGSCLVTACDNLMEQPFMADFLHSFQTLKPDALVAITRNEGPIPSSTVETGESGQLIRIIEKPDPGQILSENSALPLYAFGDAFGDALAGLTLSERGEFEIPQAIQKISDQGGVVLSKFATDRITLNSPAEYLHACFNMLAKGDAEIQSGALIAERVEIKAPVYIEHSASIEEGSVVGPFAYVMAGATVSEGAQIRDSIVFRDAVVSENAILRQKLVLPNEVIDLRRSRDNHDPIHRR